MANEENELRARVEAAHDWRPDEHDDDTSGWRGPGDRIWRLCHCFGLTQKTLLHYYESSVEAEDDFTLPSGEQLELEEASELECPEESEDENA